MVVRDGNAGAITEDVSELQAPLEPRGRVLLVVVALVPGEEDEIGIVLTQVAHVEGAHAAILIGVAGESGKDDDVLVGGILADQPFEHGRRPMPESVGHVGIPAPVLDAKGRAPAEVVDPLPGELDPFSSSLHLETYRSGFVGIEREQLRRELQDALVHRVDAEGHDLITGHLQVDENFQDHEIRMY